MLRNYLLSAWRNLKKNRTFSLINVFGLSLGIAAFLVIINYLRFEYSFDEFHKNVQNIYRIPMTVSEKDGKEQSFAFTYPAVAAALKKDFPEVRETVRLRLRSGVVRQGDIKMVEEGSLIYVDPGFFKIFSFEVEEGLKENPFRQLNDAVITQEAAVKYFGQESAIGKTLNYNGDDYTVTAVLKDVPENSHLKFNILLNYDKYIQLVRQYGGDAVNSWGWSDFYTYVLLDPAVSPAALQSKFPAFAKRHMGQKMAAEGFEQRFFLQPLKDIHLRSNYDYELSGNGNRGYLKYLAIAAAFILFIAWINYVNLTTARALDRSKEVGIRKVIGASRLQLVRQFLSESMFINLLSVVVGVTIFLISLPYFAQLIGKDLQGISFSRPVFILILLALFLTGTIVSGFYPAFVMSSYKPIQSLKSAILPGVTHRSGNLFRRSLVVVQFVAAIVLIAGAIGFYRQLEFMSNRNLGVNIRQTIVLSQMVNLDSSRDADVTSFMSELKSLPGIESVTSSGDIPGKEVGNSTGFAQPGDPLEKRCRTFAIDKNFIKEYGLEFVAGKNITSETTTNPTDVILNQTAVRILGFKNAEDALSKSVVAGDFQCKVIGVLKDYHQESLQYDFDPIVFYPARPSEMNYFSLKVNTTDLQPLIASVQKSWTKFFPQSPYKWVFLDDFFQSQYENDRLFSTVLWLFTIIAIVVASLGLFGLSLFTINKRGKEISIRKVLGASLIQITSLVTRDYLKLVLIAGIVATPLAYLIIGNWLEGYAFRINIGLWFFLFPLVLIVGIALATVLYQSLKAASANPVKNLKEL